MMNIGTKIKELRVRQRVTLGDLAKKDRAYYKFPFSIRKRSYFSFD